MRKTIIAAVAVLSLGATVVAIAQPGPAGAPPGQGREPPMASEGDHAMPHRSMMGWMHGMRGDRPINPRAFGLVYRQADRRLTVEDVRKIAEAFLLWNGNHTWKVTDVAQSGDDAVAFAVTTADGSVVARFTMDPHTARVTRTG